MTRLPLLRRRPCRNQRHGPSLTESWRRDSLSRRSRDIEHPEGANYSRPAAVESEARHSSEQRSRDNPMRVAVRALTCVQLHSRAFPRFRMRTLPFIPPHFVTATVTVDGCSRPTPDSELRPRGSSPGAVNSSLQLPHVADGVGRQSIPAGLTSAITSAIEGSSRLPSHGTPGGSAFRFSLMSLFHTYLLNGPAR